MCGSDRMSCTAKLELEFLFCKCNNEMNFGFGFGFPRLLVMVLLLFYIFTVFFSFILLCFFIIISTRCAHTHNNSNKQNSLKNEHIKNIVETQLKKSVLKNKLQVLSVFFQFIATFICWPFSNNNKNMNNTKTTHTR